VTRWEDVTFVAAHPELFGAPSDSPLRRTLGENVLTVHGREHKRLRSAMEPLLRRPAVEDYAPALVERFARPLFDAIRPNGAAELMSEFLKPVTVLALAEVLGLRGVDAATLRRWFGELAAAGSNYERDEAKDERGARVCREIEAFCVPVLRRLKGAPDGSLLSCLVNAEPGDGRLSEDEVMANLKLILLGGMQEPAHAAGNVLHALLSHPDQAAELSEEPALLDDAIEEGLRWLSPVGTATREVTEDLELDGVRLAVGERVAAVLSSANRDEARFPDAERFVLGRDSRRHRAFGIGGHFCVGHWLAREEIRVPLRMLFFEPSELRLDPARRPVLYGWEFRGPRELHVRWESWCDWKGRLVRR
jgi:cytochrome P450